MPLIELNHVIEHGMVTYQGLPAPVICDYWSREESRARYAAGTEFQIGRIDMVANTGTYLDTPFHRYADGADLSEVPLAAVAALPGVVIVSAATQIDADAFAGIDVRGCAVLIRTGWDRHWRAKAYFRGHPFVTATAAEALRDGGAALVGIDSHNIDDVSGDTRPVHSILLAAGIPIVEHLTNLAALPPRGFTFHAAPPRVRGMGTFPVRAFAQTPTAPAQ